MDIQNLKPRTGSDTYRIGDSDDLVVMENLGTIPLGSVCLQNHGVLIFCTEGRAQFEYDGNALDSMVRVQDWGYVISDKEDLRNQSISDRKKQNTYFVTTGMRIGKKDANAGGIIKGKNLAELFQKLCVGYTDSLDFSKDLPIPFAGIGHMEYIGKQFAAAQLQLQQRIGANHYALLRVAAGQQSDKAKELFDHRTMVGVQAAYYLNTIFGPIGATLGYSNHTKKAYLFVNLGYEF